MSKYQLRETALEIITRVGENGGFSHLLIDQAIKKKEFDMRDEGLLTEIVYGTIQRKLTLEYYLTFFVDEKKKIKPWLKWLCYMSLYQMTFLDRIPDHAIIHESVEIAKKKGHKGMASFVNGVLRSVQRSGLPELSHIDDPVKRLAIQSSHPAWLVERWIEMYGINVTEKMCLINLEHKPMAVRVQPLKINRETAIAQLETDGYEVERSLLSGQGIIITKGNILRSNLFSTGKITIQDQSSMMVAEMLDLIPGLTVLDACSAPGGKSTHIAEKMENKGKVHAYDLHEKKVKLVAEKASELELDIIETGQADSRQLDRLHAHETFDRILLDAPCSGLGVIRGKPDIKYSKSEKDIYQLAAIQKELLESIVPLLKKDGKLVYSTCTVDKEENEEVIRVFLDSHPEFKIDEQFFNELPDNLKKSSGLSAWGLQLFPHDFDSDGFFLTRLKKRD